MKIRGEKEKSTLLGDISEAILESIEDPITIQNTAFKVLYQNNAHKKIFGDHKGEYCFKAYRQNDHVCDGCPLAMSFREKRQYTVERIIPGEGMLCFEITASPLKDAMGNLQGGIEIVRDISERKEAEKAVRRAHAELEQIFNTAADGMRVIASDHTMIRANRTFSVLTGVNEAEVIGKKCYDVFSGAACQTPYCPLGLIMGGEKYVEYEVEKKRIDGVTVPCILTATPFLGLDGELLGIVEDFRDITERKEAEEKLNEERERLARMHVESGSELMKRLVEAEKSSLRAKDLTYQLLTFSRGGAPVKKASSLPALIRDSAQFVITGSKVRCDFSFSADLWPVEVDVGQINQVITNLVINSEQAMPDGGIIEISGENVILGSDSMLPLGNGPYVRISSKDQGIGIHKKYLAKIFDPYFTTKQDGSGLGLATVYSIIKKHDGHVTAESEPGVGTVFSIYLPASQRKVDRNLEAEGRIIGGEGRILVMDDEAAIRDIAGAMLKSLGYEVEFAGDGEETIKCYVKAQESHRPFDVVIIDLTIPGGMGGEELVKKLLKIDPAVKAIVSSGYYDDPVMAKFREYGFKAVIAKPYGIVELGKTVHMLITQ